MVAVDGCSRCTNGHIVIPDADGGPPASVRCECLRARLLAQTLPHYLAAAEPVTSSGIEVKRFLYICAQDETTLYRHVGTVLRKFDPDHLPSVHDDVDLLEDAFRRDEDKKLALLDDAPFVVIRLGQGYRHARLSGIVTEMAKRRYDMGRATWFIRAPHIAEGDPEYSPRLLEVLKLYKATRLETVTSRMGMARADAEPPNASILNAQRIARGR
jgi:hypothetical protein